MWQIGFLNCLTEQYVKMFWKLYINSLLRTWSTRINNRLQLSNWRVKIRRSILRRKDSDVRTMAWQWAGVATWLNGLIRNKSRVQTSHSEQSGGWLTTSVVEVRNAEIDDELGVKTGAHGSRDASENSSDTQHWVAAETRSGMVNCWVPSSRAEVEWDTWEVDDARGCESDYDVYKDWLGTWVSMGSSEVPDEDK